MYLEEKTAAQIINMNPFPEKGFIDADVAKRQFNVVLKGFNHLNQPGNNFLYIADEVGLGKTYIAIGIASLFRYFSSNPGNYIDIIIVPKQNLQHKWLKEIKNFITSNYCQRDNRVRSIIDKPVAQLNHESILERLAPFKNEGSRYVLMRNSSFSVASYGEEGDNEWVEKLKNKLPPEQADTFYRISKKFQGNDIIIKRAYAYLLNTLMPEVDLLIVDEAHNFKHGVNDSVSIRNQVVSRLFGACDEDEELFSAFPELKNRIQPKVKKLLLLSATPIDNGLYEIRNQLNCFLKDHRFKKINDQEELNETIDKSLNQFMIRGVMHLSLNGQKFSRNGYRHEHRYGNVNMQEIPETQILNDNRTAAFLGLLQYKTIKELKLKNNNSFEMGMLAGFESFAGHSEYEDRTIEDKTGREPKDQKIIEDLVNSYNKEFDEYPPHPKQESLVNELLDLILKRQKAIVFVRRIASVREIERKLFQKYSHYLIQKIKAIKGNKANSAIKILLKSFEDDKNRDEIENVLDRITARIYPTIRQDLLGILPDNSGDEHYPYQVLNSDIRELYNSLTEDTELEAFRNNVRKHIGLIRIKNNLKELTASLLKKKWNKTLVLEDEEDDELSASERTNEEKAPYFFQRFFYNEGKNFKKRSYNKNWYEINYLLLNDHFDLFELDCKKLQHSPELNKVKTDSKKFEICQKVIEQAIKSKVKSTCEINEVYRTNTFLNVLLTELCEKEFTSWINKHRHLISEGQYSAFLEKLASLVEILKSIFRQGSSLLPAFIAEAKSSKGEDSQNTFIDEMTILLLGEFDFVLLEIKDIIADYEQLIQINFDDPNRIRYNLIQQLPVAGVSGHHKKDVRKVAIQFRMPGYPYILIATDILKEGEDLHTYCSNIYHYGIAWNPSDMEQRTGRIDRIGSLTYKNINTIPKNIPAIPFESKLQVFYPYLADTLEVNQMVKLFKGMEEFINIFYNDISKGIEKNAKANVDSSIIDIPQQNKGLLVSKYDYRDFNLVCDKQDTLELLSHIGEIRDLLENSLNGIFKSILESGFAFMIEPEFDEVRLIISGVMKLSEAESGEFRNGPFLVYFDHGEKPGRFVLVLESCLGKIQVFGRRSNQAIVEEKLLDTNISTTEKNNEVWTKLTTEDFKNSQSVVSLLVNLICITDKLEEEIAGEDLIIDF